jgi:hypothetical protein
MAGHALPMIEIHDLVSAGILEPFKLRGEAIVFREMACVAVFVLLI